jgi:hypothetical protein
MKLVISEKRVLEYLTNNGATTKPELMAATNYSRCTIGSAIRTLIAAKRVAKHDLRKVEGHSQRLPSFVAVTDVVAQPAGAVNVFEHPEIYTRLNGLESNLGRMNRNLTELEKSMAAMLQREGSHMDRLNKAVKYLNDLDRDRIRVNDVLDADRARMDGLAERLRALHSQPAVDPAYAAIEQELRPKLEGTFPEERIRELIDEAYAQRAK